MKATPGQPLTKNCINFYLKKKGTSFISFATATANNIPENVETENNLTLKQKTFTTTVSASSTIRNREQFLKARESEVVRSNFICFNLPFEHY